MRTLFGKQVTKVDQNKRGRGNGVGQETSTKVQHDEEILSFEKHQARHLLFCISDETFNYWLLSLESERTVTVCSSAFEAKLFL